MLIQTYTKQTNLFYGQTIKGVWDSLGHSFWPKRKELSVATVNVDKSLNFHFLHIVRSIAMEYLNEATIGNRNWS